MKKLVFLPLLLSLAACETFNFSPGIGKPFSLSMKPPEGPPAYVQGWKDGCESGLSGYGNSVTKAFYRLRKSPEYNRNKVYQQIWHDSYNYCRTSMKTTRLHGWGNHTNEFGLAALLPRFHEPKRD